MDNNNLILGIDLGTTNSCITIYRNHKAEVIKNNMGSNVTPSIISFVNNQRYYEDQAKKYKINYPKNTIFNVKRLLGRNFDDKEVQNDIKYLPFNVIKDNSTNKPMIEIELNGKSEKFYPEEISAMLLSYLIKLVEKYLYKKIENVIIAVPSYFNEKQRKATLDAGKIAKLNVIQLIDEPIAAAIAYGLNYNIKTIKKILVFDFGGGTLDISVLEIGKKKFKILNSGGDSHFGGEDFDQRLVDFCIRNIEKNKKLNIWNNKKLINKLKNECENTKILLSTNKVSNLYIDNFYNKEEFNITITRSDFEKECEDLFNKCISLIEKTLKEIKLTKNDINEVILIGGTSKIPKIQKIIKDYFKTIFMTPTINPEEAIAIGAAIQGTKNYLLQLINPHSIGLNINEDNEKNITSVLIPKNAILPFEKEEIFTTSKRNQTSVAFDIYQGENYYSKDNILIGGFVIKNIRKAEEGEIDFKVNMKLDENGILSVSVIDTDNGKYKRINIKNVINFDDKDFEYFKSRERKFKKYEDDENEYEITKMNTNEYTNSINGFEDLNSIPRTMRSSKTNSNFLKNKNQKNY